MRRRSGQLSRTAYHEAGHALVAHLAGWNICSVTIIRDGSVLGSLRTESPCLKSVAAMAGDQLGQAIANAVAVKLAGPLAEAVLADGAISRDNDDYQGVREILTSYKVSAETVEKLIMKGEVTVLRALRHRWPSVTALATTLLEERMIQGSRVRDILTMPPPRPYQLELPL